MRRPLVLRLLVVAFVVATGFDSVTFAFTRPNETMSRVFGIILVVAFVGLAPGFQPKMRVFAAELRWFYVFGIVTAVEEAFVLTSGSVTPGEVTRYAVFLQLFVMALILQDLTRDPRLYRSILTAVACVVASIAVLTAFGVSASAYSSETGGLRVGTVGVNLNQLGYYYAVVAVGLVSWMLSERKVLSLSGAAKVGVLAFLVLGISLSGSRGGAVALASGLIVAAAANIRPDRAPKFMILVPLLVAAPVYFLFEQGAVAERVMYSREVGDTGSRWELLTAGLELLQEKPMVGLGTIYEESLGAALNYPPMAAHNTYLQIALLFGVLGMAPFLLGLYSLSRGLSKLRVSGWSGMWMSVLATTVAFAFVGHLADTKYFWVLVVLVANARVVAAAPARAGAAEGATRGLRVG